ncbi:MAG: hypothetical protein RL571_722 [Pseudomonadota bacterium]|jgi:predicted metal-dependent hydrolase
MRPKNEVYLLRLADKEIAYHVERSSRRRSIGLKITADGLTIVLPARAPIKDAERAIQSKLKWILAKLAQPMPAVVALAAGSSVLWQGQAKFVQLAAGRTRLEAEILYVSELIPLPTALTRFYQRSAKAYFLQRLGFWSEQMGLQPRQLFLSSAKSRWGSCTALGDIRLNWRLMQAPPQVIDYVVIHELAHLAELNHSSRFWDIVAAACPDWKTKRLWLKQNGALLFAW